MTFFDVDFERKREGNGRTRTDPKNGKKQREVGVKKKTNTNKTKQNKTQTKQNKTRQNQANSKPCERRKANICKTMQRTQN